MALFNVPSGENLFLDRVSAKTCSTSSQTKRGRKNERKKKMKTSPPTPLDSNIL